MKSLSKQRSKSGCEKPKSKSIFSGNRTDSEENCLVPLPRSISQLDQLDFSDPAMFPEAKKQHLQKRSQTFTFSPSATDENSEQKYGSSSKNSASPEWLAYLSSLLQGVFATVYCRSCAIDQDAKKKERAQRCKSVKVESSLELPTESKIVSEQPFSVDSGTEAANKQHSPFLSRKSAAKKAAAAAANSPNSTTVNGHNVTSAVNGGGGSTTPIPVGSIGRKGCGGGASPLGTSPSTTNSNSSLFSSFTSSLNSHHPQQQQANNHNTQQHHHNQHQTQQPTNAKFNHNNNNNHDCSAGVVPDMNGCNASSSNVPSTGSSPSSANTTANFHISSLPFSLVGALRGASNNNNNANNSSSVNGRGSPNGRDYSPSGDCVGVRGGGGGVSVAPYLLCCESVEHRRRFEECKSMVQLPNGFDRLEWLAYHATFLVRFVGMFWLSNGLSQQCRCSHLTAPHNLVWVMQDERNGKKSGGGGMSLRMAPLTSSFTSFSSSSANATATSASHHSSHSFSGVSFGGGSGSNSSSSSSGMDARTAIENSLRNLEKILDNEELFPSKYGSQFNGDFENLVRRSCRSLFCIVSHLLHAHFATLQQQQQQNKDKSSLQSSLIDLFSYLITFTRQFSLIDKKELAATEDLELSLSQKS